MDLYPQQVFSKGDSMSKIIEKIVEPTKIQIGSIFKLKVKAIRYLKYKEMKTQNYTYFISIKYRDLKGE